MAQQTQRTLRKPKLVRGDKNRAGEVYLEDGMLNQVILASTDDWAKQILHAVNHYDQLVEALRESWAVLAVNCHQPKIKVLADKISVLLKSVEEN